MVAGLGTITPASGFVGPMGAVAIGLTAGVVCFFATQFMKRKLKIDDSLDVFPVHGVGGFTGLLLTAVFSATAFDGLGLPDGVTISASQFVTQLIGAVATAVWSGVATFVILKVVNVVRRCARRPRRERRPRPRVCTARAATAFSCSSLTMRGRGEARWRSRAHPRPDSAP